ncbi:MAG TPA: sensor histidine kinase [Longimicrobiales bacterium]|nr:sensor histidine kinase [Longimicrobiales bacterium]
MNVHPVFVNLVANAVRFTDRGEVIIRARVLEDGGVEVTVADTGRGIQPEELPRVFDRFYRGDAARGADGSGLGLAIARLIVEQHGGSVEAESEPGRGSTFRVVLPA